MAGKKVTKSSKSTTKTASKPTRLRTIKQSKLTGRRVSRAAVRKAVRSR